MINMVKYFLKRKKKVSKKGMININGINREADISLTDLVNTLFKNWKIIAVGIFLFSAVALVFSFMGGLSNPVTYKYGARTTIEIVKERGMDKQDSAVIALMTSDEVMDAALNNLDITTGTDEIKANISAELSESNEINITAYDNDPNTAKEIANEIRRQGINLASKAISYDKLALVEEAVPIQNPKIIGNSHKYALNLSSGAVLGFIIAVLYIFVLKFFNQKISTRKDVERFTGKKVLVSIPSSVKKSRKFYEVI